MFNVRAKFQCFEKGKSMYNPTQDLYKFQAVCQDETPEDKRFHKYSPSGRLEITVDNPDVSFELGKKYYLDFTEVEEGV